MGRHSGEGPAEVTYENTADQIWTSIAVTLQQNAELELKAFHNDGVTAARIWGRCPRCGHDLNLQLTYTAAIPGLRGAPGVPELLDVGCGCGRIHPGAPEGTSGCGVSFYLADPDTPPSTLGARSRDRR